MEIKKSKKADLESKKTLFLEIGLSVSLLLMITVFAWGTDRMEIDDVKPEEIFEPVEQVEITRQDVPVPSVPTPAQALSIITDRIRIVDNDTKIETQQVFKDLNEDFAFTDNVISTVEIAGVTDDEIFMVVEDMPKFQGGDIEKFRSWVASRVVYPPMAKELGITGVVVLSFVIEKNGVVSNVEALSQVDRLLTEEAIKVVKSSPVWEPGRQRDVPARVKCTMPINFRME